ncbi:MAG: Hpt domain-containing protein, partial [Stenotrophomonas sp.]|nr:Hpt domain-containing protein [Stenotrophomonas sp.]
RQQIDENLLLDIAGALLYVDASLDDQVAHLGAGGSGEDDPSAVENRRTVEVLAHEAIANFAAAREHFVAFIETSWNHAELQDVPRLLGDVSGALRMLDLGTAADYLRGVQQYIEAELIGRQRVPSGRQLDTLADAMASLEYYLEALRDRRPGREDILEITRSSLEALRYWPLPERNAVAPEAPALLPVEREPVALQAEPLQPERIEVPVQPAAPAAGDVPVPLPDFTFDPPPATPAPMVFDNRLMFGALGTVAAVAASTADNDASPLPTHDDAEASLVFAASSAPAPDVPQWELAPFHPEADAVAPADDERSPTFASFDPVSFELAEGDHSGASQWSLSEVPQVPEETAAPAINEMTDAVDSSATAFDAAPVFDPVAAEQDAAAEADDVVFRFDADALDNADDVLSLHAMETLSLDDDAALHPSLEIVDAVVPPLADASPAVLAEVDEAPDDLPVPSITPPLIDAAAPAAETSAPAVSVIDIDTIAPIDFSEADAQFFAELSAAAAGFNPQAMAAAAAPEAVVAAVAGTDADTDTNAGFDAGFDDDAENIDEDIREVFLEEFDDELANLGTLLPAWRMQPDNMDRLRPIRRIFHTLKGSGRLVGARTLGEFAWKIEGMLNRVLDGSRAASPAVLAMVDNAHAALPQLNAALRHGQRISVDLQAMQAIADRVGAGEETYYVPLPGAAAPVAPVAESEGEDEISRILDAEAGASALADTAEEAEAAGTPANIDSVLREILEAEVEVHQATLQDWLRSAQQAPQPVSDALLRAVHTMNGAFAMTEVPEITAVTGGAESYIKRALAAEVVPGDEGVAALDATAQAITATMEALQAEQPRIAPQQVLAQRLQALAGELPEARWPMVGLEDDEDDLALDDEPAAELDADASTAVALESDAVPHSFVTPEQEAEAHADTAEAPFADVAIEAGLEVGELTASDDLSRYFDAGWPSVPGEEEASLPAVESIQVADDVPGVAVDDVEGEAESVPLLSNDAGLTVVDDLSPYLDASALPVDDRDAEEIPVAVEAVASDLNASSFDHAHVADAEAFETPAALPLDSELSSLQDEMAAPGFAEPVSLEAALEAGLHVIDEEQPLADDGQWPVLGLQASELAPGEAEAFAEDADVGGEAAIGEGESADQPSPATVNDEIAESVAPATAEPVRFFELEDAPGQADVHAEAEAADVDAVAVSDAVAAGTPEADVPETVTPDVLAMPVLEDSADALDFSVYDRELVDIFVEEGKDLLDHCDGLISELRDAPQDREVLAGLQRDLHTLKGGARMAGINAIGDLGHSIESLLEA